MRAGADSPTREVSPAALRTVTSEKLGPQWSLYKRVPKPCRDAQKPAPSVRFRRGVTHEDRSGEMQKMQHPQDVVATPLCSVA
jgi:hypothetical protein